MGTSVSICWRRKQGKGLTPYIKHPLQQSEIFFLRDSLDEPENRLVDQKPVVIIQSVLKENIDTLVLYSM